MTNLNLTDLQFASDGGADMEVLHPTERTPLKDANGASLSIRVVGTDSDTYTAAAYKQRDANIEDLRRRAKFSSAADDYKGAKLLAKCTLGWNGIPMGWVDGTRNNEPAEFSYENAVKLYTNRGVRWLRDQVDEFIADRANFLRASSGT